MLEFHSANSSDINLIQEYFKKFKEYSCEFSIVNLSVWQKHFCFEFCIDDGVLYTKNCINGKTTFGIPFTNNMKSAIEKLKEYSNEKGIPFILYGCDGERLDIFNAEFSEKFEFFPIRDAFEYIYNRQDLSTLSGKKYHSKRNHISAFKKKYNWSFEELNSQNTKQVIEMLDLWYNENSEKLSNTMEIEKNGLNKILNNGLNKGMKGAVLKVDERVIAFTLGCEISTEIFDVNFEKALKDYNGAYAMINQQFAQNLLWPYKYINREDDLGLEGLRKAKLSYKPQRLLAKYLITMLGE